MDAYSRWDHTETLACLTDDVEWVVPGAFHLSGKAASTTRSRAMEQLDRRRSS